MMTNVFFGAKQKLIPNLKKSVTKPDRCIFFNLRVDQPK